MSTSPSSLATYIAIASASTSGGTTTGIAPACLTASTYVMGVIIPAGPSLPVIALLLTTMLVTPIMGGSLDRRFAAQPITSNATMITTPIVRNTASTATEHTRSVACYTSGGPV